MNKSAATNLIALVIVVTGTVIPRYGDIVIMTGLFALSGGVTNWLAVHMLFDKIPFLYGSGVIPNQFEEFKAVIKSLMVQEFFTREHIERFFNENGTASVERLIERINFDHVFDHLANTIAESSMGSMLKMVGGVQALEPLKDPVTAKMKDVIAELAIQPLDENQGGGNFTDALVEQIESIIDQRLAEWTPEMVKDIVEDMMRQHLGWLVVWGGVIGGCVGLAVSLSDIS